MSDVQRLRPAKDILKAAQVMMSWTTLEDLMKAMKCSRSGAERFRNAGRDLFGLYDRKDPCGKKKQFRIANGHILPRLISFSLDDLILLNFTADHLRQNKNEAYAKMVDDFSIKIKALLNPANRSGLETDLEGLVAASGFSHRPGPKFKVPVEMLRQISTAILAYKKITIHYRNRDGKRYFHKVDPYAVINNTRQYLVCWNDYSDDYRHYCISNIEKIKVHDEYFERREEFDVRIYLKDLFGVFREEPFGVELKIAKSAAADAREFIFHPSQQVSVNKNGSLSVKFFAGGAEEMCRHFFIWGRALQVVKPLWLREKYRGLLTEVLKTNK